MKSAPSKSSLPAERRKQSETDRRRQQSAKSSPTREMAPFFSVFYRGISGISRVTKSQSRSDLLEKDGEREGDKAKAKTTQTHGESRKCTTADKPPHPLTKAKGNCATDGHGVWDKANKKGGIRSKSTADLHAAKAAAAAEGKNWRERDETAPSTSSQLPTTPNCAAVSSAPNSPSQSASSRKWPLGLFSRTHSRDLCAVHSKASPPAKVVNGLSRHQPKQRNGTEQKPTDLSFTQRIRLHKGVRTGKIPMDALHQTYRSGSKKGEMRAAVGGKGVGFGIYLSADDICQLNHDTDYIAEALRTLGDEQPRVARSTPKHAFISEDPRKVLERQRRHCIYGENVYDKMVAESLLVCDLLQNHLGDCIAGVRAKSPAALSSPFTTPPGSPFMTRSTSMQPFQSNGGGTAKPISRVTISVSPMAHQAHHPLAPVPHLPPFPTAAIAPPEVRITRPSFEGMGILLTISTPTAERRHLKQFAM